MGIQKDAGELLLYTYKKYSEGKLVTSQEVQQQTEWDDIKMKNAFVYLKDRALIEGIFFMGGNFIIRKIYPEAIDIAENEKDFEEIFGFKPKSSP